MQASLNQWESDEPCSEEGQMGVRMKAAALGLLGAPMGLSTAT